MGCPENRCRGTALHQPLAPQQRHRHPPWGRGLPSASQGGFLFIAGGGTSLGLGARRRVNEFTRWVMTSLAGRGRLVLAVWLHRNTPRPGGRNSARRRVNEFTRWVMTSLAGRGRLVLAVWLHRNTPRPGGRKIPESDFSHSIPCRRHTVQVPLRRLRDLAGFQLVDASQGKFTGRIC